MTKKPTFLPAFVAAVGDLTRIVGIESKPNGLLITTVTGEQIKFPLATNFHDGFLAEVTKARAQIALKLNVA
jgi:hypothetical protein